MSKLHFTFPLSIGLPDTTKTNRFSELRNKTLVPNFYVTTVLLRVPVNLLDFGLMSPMSYEFAILEMYRKSTPKLREKGTAWYQTAQDEARSLAKQYKTTYRIAAAVIAALSPRTKWEQNKGDARAILRAVASGSRIKPKVTAYNRNRDKAWKIAKGGKPSDVLSGPKVTAFYANIMGDYTRVTVDIWIARIVEPYHHNPAIRPAHYALIESAVVSAASKVETYPAVLQAICWVTIKGFDGNSDQLLMFGND